MFVFILSGILRLKQCVFVLWYKEENEEDEMKLLGGVYSSL